MQNLLDRRRFIAGVGVSALGSSAFIPLAEANAKENSAMNVMSHQHFDATPSINPELVRLIAVETEAKARLDEYCPIHSVEGEAHMARRRALPDDRKADFYDEAWEPIEAEYVARLDIWCDRQLDVVAFPAIERQDVIAKAKWIADRYNRPDDFMQNEADAIWAAFVAIAETAT